MRSRERGLGPGEQYLRDYPALERWMNRCAACGQRGYRPELPERSGGWEANLRRYFEPMPLDARGRCETCAAALDAR